MTNWRIMPRSSRTSRWQCSMYGASWSAWRVVGDALDALEAAIERALEDGQEAGEVRAAIDCGAHARMLVALMQGLHVVARVEDDPGRLGDAVDAALAPLAA